MIVEVFCTTVFEAIHWWPNAPESVGYLRNRHRHLFHVKVWKLVEGLDRQIEFITLKQAVNEKIAVLKCQKCETWSCEQWAVAIMKNVGACRVEVSEDGENGALVTAESVFDRLLPASGGPG